MFKFSKFVLAVCVLMAGLLVGSSNLSFAGPASQLSSMQILQVYSDGGQSSDVPANYPNAIPDGIVFTGHTLYVTTRFNGYPNWATLFYRDSSSTGSIYPYTEFSRQMIGNPARGWIQTVEIPFTAFSGSYVSICATADSNQGITRSAMVTNIHIQK